MVNPADGYRFGDDHERVRACVTAAYSRQHSEGMVKVWEDVARYCDLLEMDTPELIIECGTHTGASARFFAAYAEHVITIDVHDKVSAGLPPNVTALIGSSLDRGIASTVRGIARGYDRVMVVLDSDHSAAHVTSEILTYGGLVTPGQYLVVEDAIARWMPNETKHGTPYDAIEERLVGNPLWTNDTALRDMYPITMFPDGWWKRNASRSV